MKKQDWVKFGKLYDTLLDAGIIVDIVTMQDEDKLFFSAVINDEHLGEWVDTPLEVINTVYIKYYLEHDSNAIIDSLTDYEMEQINEIADREDISFDEVISNIISDYFES